MLIFDGADGEISVELFIWPTAKVLQSSSIASDKRINAFIVSRWMAKDKLFCSCCILQKTHPPLGNRTIENFLFDI
jgi:hypothetical protein